LGKEPTKFDLAYQNVSRLEVNMGRSLLLVKFLYQVTVQWVYCWSSHFGPKTNFIHKGMGPNYKTIKDSWSYISPWRQQHWLQTKPKW